MSTNAIARYLLNSDAFVCIALASVLFLAFNHGAVKTFQFCLALVVSALCVRVIRDHIIQRFVRFH